MRKLMIQNCSSQGLKGTTYTEKWDQPEMFLLTCEVAEITKIPYLINLAPVFLSPEGPLE